MTGCASDVTGRQQNIPNLSLKAHVPLPNAGVVRVPIHRQYDGVQRKGRIRCKPATGFFHWERISAWITGPRVIKGNIINDDPLGLWWSSEAGLVMGERIVVKRPSRCPEGGATISGYIPCKAYAGGYIPPLIVHIRLATNL